MKFQGHQVWEDKFTHQPVFVVDVEHIRCMISITFATLNGILGQMPQYLFKQRFKPSQKEGNSPPLEACAGIELMGVFQTHGLTFVAYQTEGDTKTKYAPQDEFFTIVKNSIPNENPSVTCFTPNNIGEQNEES